MADDSADRSFFISGRGLFLASFISLFLELLIIRWVPSINRVLAYYGNLMLISSFLGLGCGILLSTRHLGLRRYFAIAQLCLILFVFYSGGLGFKQGPDELRFLLMSGANTTIFPIIFIFALNALVFVPLGEIIGGYFERLPPLRAYSWDIGGAVAGTIIFGLFSYFWFSPLIGFVIVMLLFLLYEKDKTQITTTGVIFTLTLLVIFLGADKTAIWSPYSLISIKEIQSDGGQKPVSQPAAKIDSLQDPPTYVIQVNHDFYMMNGTIDERRYTTPAQPLLRHSEQYRLPYLIRPGVESVLVLGSGGGVDVEAALLSGVKRVDAVEIDPVIIELGHRYNASQSYKDARVSIFNNDAREYFRQTDKSYDMIVFGFLDSQGLFSQFSNVRLDGYVYTRESFREAFQLLREGGLLSISFFSAGKLWLLDRLVSMVTSATNTDPLVYVSPSGQVIILAAKNFTPEIPDSITRFQRIPWVISGTPEATDDWPYLYLRTRFIPLDYLITIATLLIVSLLFVFLCSNKNSKRLDLHFFFLGAGFMLLETKSITSVSLYFGTTWFVSMIVILGVLFMVLLANLLASRLNAFSTAMSLIRT